MKKLFLFLLLTFLPCNAFAWNGYDYDSGSYIEIESGQLVRNGLEIEIYDYGTYQYHAVEVVGIYRFGSVVEIEVYDYTHRKYRTFEMEKS